MLVPQGGPQYTPSPICTSQYMRSHITGLSPTLYAHTPSYMCTGAIWRDTALHLKTKMMKTEAILYTSQAWEWVWGHKAWEWVWSHINALSAHAYGG